jgi:hypothetical protein
MSPERHREYSLAWRARRAAAYRLILELQTKPLEELL